MEARSIESKEEFSIKEENPIKVDVKNIKSTTDLSEKEKKMINKVLLKYNYEVKNVIKVKSAYKLETSIGDIRLRKIKHKKLKLKTSSKLIEELNEKGSLCTVKYFKDANGNNYVRYKDSSFYATEWIDGTECDLNNLDEAINCVKLLAQYHLTAKSISTKKVKVKNNLKNWAKIFSSGLQEIDKFERMIGKRKIRGQFDTTYYNYIESFYNRGMAALKFLNTSDYYRLFKKAGEERTLCYNNFYRKNIIQKDNKYYLIDLYNIVIDLYVNDLGKFIRRLMFKNSYQWDFEKAKTLIQAYDSINKLSKNELEVMLALIIFPYKFWKLGKKRYLKHKIWDESKYMHKLTKLIKCNDAQNKFLDDYLQYIENYM